MVFLIQNTQNRDARAINLKLNELIRAIDKARNQMIDIENLSDLGLMNCIRIAKTSRPNIASASSRSTPSSQTRLEMPQASDGNSESARRRPFQDRLISTKSYSRELFLKYDMFCHVSFVIFDCAQFWAGGKPI
jgi:hypothetical protein